MKEKYETLCIDCLKVLCLCIECDNKAKDKGVCDKCKRKFNYS